MRLANSLKENKRRKAISAGLRRANVFRRCPHCDRGGALKRVDVGFDLHVMVCRYCNSEFGGTSNRGS